MGPSQVCPASLRSVRQSGYHWRFRIAPIAVILALLPAVAQVTDPSDIERVTVSGEAIGLGPAARHEAAGNALKALVAQELENWVPSRNLVTFAPIIDHAEAYVRTYQIVKQETTEESTRVDVEAVVDSEMLRKNAAALALDALMVPAQLVLIGGRCAEWDNAPLPLLTQTLADELKGRRFDQSPADEVLRRFGDTPLDIENNDQLQRLCLVARGLLADMVVCGSAHAVSEPLANGKGVHENRVTVTVKVVRALDGLVVDTHTASGKVHSLVPEEGCRQAVLDACAKLPESILRSVVLGMFLDDARESVFLTIENPGTTERVEEIASAIKADWHVESVDTLYASTTLARLKIRYTGQVRPLAVYFAEKHYSDFELNTRTVIGRDLTLEVNGPT
ncbi:MAG: hypothetical protein AMXMBFR84_13460 [Candidatus Hydrogenedentota bacterium]